MFQEEKKKTHPVLTKHKTVCAWGGGAGTRPLKRDCTISSSLRLSVEEERRCATLVGLEGMDTGSQAEPKAHAGDGERALIGDTGHYKAFLCLVNNQAASLPAHLCDGANYGVDICERKPFRQGLVPCQLHFPTSVLAVNTLVISLLRKQRR